MREVAFGQCYPTDSFLHRCDPRAKIIFLIFYIATIYTTDNFYGLAICAAAFLIIAFASKVPFKNILKSVKAIIFLVVFTAILNLFFHSGDTVIWQWKFIKLTKEGIYFTIFLSVRLFLLVTTSSLLTLTTTPVSLTDGLESLLTPLKFIKFPVHAFALMMSIALRSIPILMDETTRIMNAQKARGADFETGGLIKRVKAIIPVLVPLLLSAFRRSDELGDAMDARCYSGSKVRTKYKKLTFSWRDIIVFLFTAILFISILVLKNFVPGII